MSLATRPLSVLSALVAAVLLAGCGATDTDAGSGRQAVASFYPLAWVSERVAGDEWEVTNLTQPGSEPHDLGLDISRTALIEEAAVVVFERGFQPAVDEAVDNVAGGIEVDAAEAVELIPAGEGHDHGEPGHEGEEGQEDGDGHEAEEGHGDLDPHFWLDPLLMADLADVVAEALAEADPEGAETYTDNAAALRTELEQLDTAYSEGLAACERDTVVVSHDAFGYLERYGLHFEGIAGLTPDAEPTPAVLAHLQELIAGEGITTVFSERLASPAMAEALARDAGVQTAVLDPIEGPDGSDDADEYVALMEQNLAALREANGC
ncbi:zinc ABC transporter substrate-binding protein [Nocardioides seonyuensis]|uniref:Zinc ABC transporter substrate-binding protein n=1 Tax=Nocardioides seonyuensis TaxID=2518371 RepID=A0A4P7IGZ8_9ACTN|nr:metal ABC transporter substrate-binding protein [Nocardioides seonyuensis]QBX56629.1 zinc ABC transporter substrate-binding protein [Nocardioides seonyuensis]